MRKMAGTHSDSLVDLAESGKGGDEQTEHGGTVTDVRRERGDDLTSLDEVAWNKNSFRKGLKSIFNSFCPSHVYGRLRMGFWEKRRLCMGPTTKRALTMIDSDVEPRGDHVDVVVSLKQFNSLRALVHLDEKRSVDELRLLRRSELLRKLLQSTTTRLPLIRQQQRQDVVYHDRLPLSCGELRLVDLKRRLELLTRIRETRVRRDARQVVEERRLDAHVGGAEWQGVNRR